MRDLISAPAISSPHQGSSYNPSIDAYKELLHDAVKIEEKKEAEAKKYEAIKATMDSARRPNHGYDVPVAEGMIIDIPGDDASQEEADVQEESIAPNKVTRRKTQQQRRKALRVLEEVS
jgi:nucleolar protein 53